MTDIIGGIQYQPSNDGAGGVISNVSGVTSCVYPQGTGTECPLLSGVWPNFGSKSIINFAVGRVQDAANVKIPVGDGSNANGSVISASWTNGMHAIVNDGTGSLNAGVPDVTKTLTNGTDVYISVRYTPNGYFGCDVYGTDGAIIRTQSTNPIGVLGAIQPTASSRIAGIALYGWAGFSFTNGIPADYLAAFNWMMADWINKPQGSRFLYPGWAGF